MPRRYRVPLIDFDTRPNVLKQEIGAEWGQKTKQLWQNNKQGIIDSLRYDFGEKDLEVKIKNFCDIGAKPFSIIVYHNEFFEQARRSFVCANYYAALTCACALGERILNHLVLDLRASFTASPHYRKVHNKSSFDNWKIPLDALYDWKVINKKVYGYFDRLKNIRNRSIHFNASLYKTCRKDALAAIHLLNKIINEQFGAFSTASWFMKGVKGASFIKKSYEDKPFIKTYYIPNSLYVGPYHEMINHNGRWGAKDFKEYSFSRISDKKFKELYNGRSQTDICQ